MQLVVIIVAILYSLWKQESVLNPARELYLPSLCSTIRGQYSSLRGKVFIALNVYNSEVSLPYTLDAITTVCRVIQCQVSIYESRSTDKSVELLDIAREWFTRNGIPFTIVSDRDGRNPLSRNGKHRIDVLAAIRNRAIEALVDAETVLFLNDVVVCAQQILDLLLMHQHNDADLSCGMDWMWDQRTKGLTFYDNWVARTINGHLFLADENLLSAHAPSRDAYDRGDPFQVFACWNGMAAIKSDAFLKHKISFRAAEEGECNQSEALLFAKDLWKVGMSRVMVVPTINLAYTVEDALQLKSSAVKLKRIDFSRTPPIEIKCQSIPPEGGSPWCDGCDSWESVRSEYTQEEMEEHLRVKEITETPKRRAREHGVMRMVELRRKGVQPMPVKDVPDDHPIYKLIEDANERAIVHEPSTFEEVVQIYRARRGHAPPPGFDLWYAYAKSRNCSVVEHYFDRIHSDLHPFLSVSPHRLRILTQSAANVKIRSGKVITQIKGFHQMISQFAEFLPDLDFFANELDEPALIVGPIPHDIQMTEGNTWTELDPDELLEPADDMKSGWREYTGDNGRPYWPKISHLCTDPPDWQYRGFISDWKASKSACIPEWRHIHGALQVPVTTRYRRDLVPVFSSSKLSVNSDILVPPALVYEYYQRINHLDESPWSGDRIDGMIWRGSATGGTGLSHRHRLIEFAKSRAWLDARFTNLVDDEDEVEPMSMDVQQYYKYNIDVDGNAYSGRFIALLSTRALTLKATIFSEWLDGRLIPWYHFVPVSIGYTDLDDVVAFFQAREDLAERIAIQGSHAARELLSRFDMEVYLFRLLLEYSRILRRSSDGDC